MNLYQEGFATDGVTPTLTLVDTTMTTSWDKYAQGFRTDGVPNMNCPGQGASSGTLPDLFFFSLYNQPAYLDLYNQEHINPGSINTSPATTPLPNNSQFKCYDGMHNWNQVQPAPYDGMYQFPSVTSVDLTTGKPNGTNCKICAADPVPTTGTDADPLRAGLPMLPPGKYVVEVVLPPGYELVKEEDKNILIGDSFIAPVTQEFGGLGNIFIIPDQASVASLFPGAGFNANNAQNSTNSLGTTPLEGIVPGFIPEPIWPCVGEARIVPDYISLFPQSQQVAPFAGATRNLCDRKEVTLGNQMGAIAKFYIYTSTHIAAKFTGGITDDYTSEFDPFSPQFGEKFAPPDLPISVKDWAGNEISRVYADHWGSYDGMTYSTWEVNPPNPTGYSPTMMVLCMNDPGPIPNPANLSQMITDPAFTPGYSQFCYELPFMPGTTEYLDTPVVPTSAFAGAGYNNVDCAYPDQTPAIAEVDGDGVGPWVAAGTGHTLKITALGDQTVTNHAYTGPQATTAPFNQKTITRHYGFGATQGTGTVAITGPDGVAHKLTGVSWSDLSITGTVPTGVPSCPIQQQAQYGGSTAQCGQLVITAGNGKQSIDTVTVTIGGKAPTHIAASGSIQAAIDAANPGDLLIIDPTCNATTGTVSCEPTTSATAKNPAVTSTTNSTHDELVIMWKPVRLQGVGSASSVINATTHPAGKLDSWRARIACLFGLSLQGTPVTNANTYDPTGVVQCGMTGTTPWTAYHTTPYTKDSTGQLLDAQVDPLPLEAIVGWDATQNGNLAQLLQEPTLMGALEGAGITVVGKGVSFPIPLNDPSAVAGGTLGSFPAGTTQITGPVGINNGSLSLTTGDGNTQCKPSKTNPTNPFPSNYMCNPSSIDGVSITQSSQGGGGIFVHGWAHNLQIANNHIFSNAGTLSGGINLGQGEFAPSYLQGGTTNEAPGSCVSNSNIPTGGQQPYCNNLNLNIHNNDISLNSSTGDELFSGTPAGAGGISICTGADYYKFNYNWVCGNLSSGDGGGVGHLGVSFNGDIEHNSILFNQSLNPTVPANGGGLLIMGTPDADPVCGSTTDQDCVSAPTAITPSDGVGPNLVINANLIQGNASESGSGGGLRLQNVNGGDVLAFPKQPSQWWNINITNNIIVNNVAGWDGAGISLLDALNTNIAHNTVASNSTTASAGILFTALGAPLASAPSNGAENCYIGAAGSGSQASCPQVAGLVAIQNSAVLEANLPTAGVVCPPNHGTGGTQVTAGSGSHKTLVGNLNAACSSFSYPYLADNIFWQNSAYFIGVGATSAQYQQNVVSLYNANFGTGSPTLAPTQPQADATTANPNGGVTITGGTGACVTASFWDIGVRGDTGPSNHNGSKLGTGTFPLTPINSVLTDVADYGDPSNIGSNPSFTSQYCNGGRTPPEFGASGYFVPPGISDATVPNPIFNLTPVATVDEGNNWINLRWGPLSLVNPVTGTPLGNYAPNGNSPVVDHIPNSAYTAVTRIVGATQLGFDFFGNPRPESGGGSPVDIGAVEFQASKPGILTVTPSPMPAFPSTLVNSTSAAQTLTLANSGGGQATGIGVTFAGPFSRPAGGAGGTCGATLNAGATCTINVVFTPTATGSATGTATINASVAVFGSPVALSGTGAAPTYTATVSPSPLAFGNWATGTSSNPKSVTVTNTGNSPLTNGTFAFAGGTPQPFSRPGGTSGGTCTATLAVGASCTIGVDFAPATAVAFSRTLTVAYADSGTAATVTGSVVTLTGTGVATKAPVSIAPNPLTITDAAGTFNNTGTVTFTNNAAAGGSSVAVTGVTVNGSGFILLGGGAGIWGFTSQTDNCTGTNLAPGANCTVVVNFGRLGAVGTHTGSIAFADSGATSPTGVLTGVAK
jgi:hypothetical protein